MTLGKADHHSVALQMSKQVVDAYKLHRRIMSCTMLGAFSNAGLNLGGA
eukprot:CAMPEP_0204114100 /NCGR_PEP_ID=MMETSP0361-20130328/4048_1 /ASSEMBLY_ACC=CAM_ASM_000343 /TAXON_ID=268821 /ORGANISM="Scrippsiella Hangoei, Strain SHTV-5" /LENGTH=48 /DNA_ID= /DNA_START= /DNA_END= /DNA_ORIENTATION=